MQQASAGEERHMPKWEQLIAARQSKHLSQWEAAELVEIGRATYQRWESGQARPQPLHMRRLREVFGPCFDERDGMRSFKVVPASSTTTVRTGLLVVSHVESDEAQAFITANLPMTTRLWALALQQHSSPDEKRGVIKQAIEEFDSMNTDNKNYQITRREALRSLATLPVTMLGLTVPETTLTPAHYGNALAQCAASVEACWELRRSSDANDRLLTFQCATKYLSLLETIAHYSSPYRAEALGLAAQYAYIKAYTARHDIGLAQAIQYGKKAIALSQESGDLSSQVRAYIVQAWSYFYDKQYLLAEKTALDAEQLVHQSTRLASTPPLPPQVQGKMYSILAITQAKNGKAPDWALGKALETDPGDQDDTFMDFKRSILLLEAGWAYCHQGDQVQAMALLEQRVDLKTLAPKIPQSGIGRVATLNVMALSSLKAKNRDMEKTIHVWTAGIEGARALQSEQRFSEAVTIYELMDVVWPGEERIKGLRDLIVHWE